MATQITPVMSRGERLWFLLMPILARLTIGVLGALGAMAVFIEIAHKMARGKTHAFDAAVIHYFWAYHYTTLHTFMTGVSWAAGKYGMPLTVVVCMGILALTHRSWVAGATLLWASGGGLALIVVLKAFFHRPRPLEIFNNLGYSFPSGHSFFSLTIYGFMAYWLTCKAPRARRLKAWSLAVAGALLVGFSRVFLGEHYPSDVAAGYAVAVPWLWGCLALPNAFGSQQCQPALTLLERQARYETGQARLKEAALFLPNLVKLAGRLAKDPRVPRSRKFALVLLVAYLASPLDLIPDFIPVIGLMDDLIIAGLVLRWVIKAVPREEVNEHWDGQTDLWILLQHTQEGIADLTKPT